MILYDCTPAPSPRRARFFIAEKGLDIPKKEIDLRNGEQFSDVFRAINPRCTVPVLELDDGTRLTDNASIARYIEETHPVPPLLGTTALEKALVAEWNARVEYEGFLAAAEAVRNRSKGFAGHALTGAKGYEQIPALAERGMARSKDFLTMLDARLGESRYVAGDFYSVVDISAVIAVDFIGWLKITIAPEQKNLQRWFDEISARPAYKA